MNPLADANANAENLVRKLMIAGLVGGAIVAGGHYYLTREPSSAELFEQANPGWTAVEADGRPVRVDDASGRGDVMLRGDDLGPYRIRRVDCDEVRKVFPTGSRCPTCCSATAPVSTTPSARAGSSTCRRRCR